MIACFVDDLVLGSRIRSTAESLGISIGFCRDQQDFDKLLNSSEADSVAVVLIDVESVHPTANLIQGIRERNRSSAFVGQPIRIIAFGPHVRRDLHEAAREAGVDDVVTRKEMFSDLRSFLHHVGGHDASS